MLATLGTGTRTESDRLVLATGNDFMLQATDVRYGAGEAGDNISWGPVVARQVEFLTSRLDDNSGTCHFDFPICKRLKICVTKKRV